MPDYLVDRLLKTRTESAGERTLVMEGYVPCSNLLLQGHRTSHCIKPVAFVRHTDH